MLKMSESCSPYRHQITKLLTQARRSGPWNTEPFKFKHKGQCGLKMRVYQSETGCYQIISGAHTRTSEILERNPEYDHPFCFRVVEQARDLLGWQLFLSESQSSPKESMVFVMIFWRISHIMPKTAVLSNIHILVYRSDIDSSLNFSEKKKDPKSHAVIKAVKQYFCEVYKRYEEKLVGEDNVKKRRMIVVFKGKVSQSDERN